MNVQLTVREKSLLAWPMKIHKQCSGFDSVSDRAGASTLITKVGLSHSSTSDGISPVVITVDRSRRVGSW